MLKYKITNISKGAQEIKIFQMEPETGTKNSKLVYEPGQFVMIHELDKEGNSLDKRPYSIASEPSNQKLEFCIKMTGGKFTSKLDKLKTGAILGIEGPLGHMHAKSNKVVLICGGTGIAPVMSLARDIVKQKKKGNFHILYSARTRNNVVYHDELMEMQKKNKDLEVIITLTREEPKGWDGYCGRIDQTMINNHIKNPKEFEYFICGPLKMTLAMKECIIGMGAKEENVHFEGWG